MASGVTFCHQQEVVALDELVLEDEVDGLAAVVAEIERDMVENISVEAENVLDVRQ